MLADTSMVAVEFSFRVCRMRSRVLASLSSAALSLDFGRPVRVTVILCSVWFGELFYHWRRTENSFEGG